MELASQIKLPGEKSIDSIESDYVSPSNERRRGLLRLTNFKLIFTARSEMATEHATSPTTVPQNVISLQLPLGVIRVLEKENTRSSPKAMRLCLVCKDLRSVKFVLASDRMTEFVNQLERYLHPVLNKLPLFAVVFGESCIKANLFTEDNGWSIYNAEEEFQRQNIFTNGWRVTKINMDYRLSETYPSLLAVPCDVTNELLARCAPHRTKSRVPTLSWLHPDSKASLTRSSQPRVGSTGRRCEEDETVVRLIRTANANANSLLIFDARPQVNAVANRARGGGFEDPAYYKDVQYMFLNIKNIHAMRASLLQVYEACFPDIDDQRWWKKLADTKWLNHIKHIIFAATSVADKIENHKASVLVHCSDGWDRTPQVTSLAMLMLDPFYRTLRGFEILIEKEWCSFGHMFALRTGGPADRMQANARKLSNTDDESTESQSVGRKTSEDERSPVFVQFIDCVWQMMQQFPHSFEFNERLLITILDELYAARFGTFLFNCEKDSHDFNARTQTISLWSFVNADSSYYQNPFYTPAEISGHRIIFPQHSLAQLQFWTRYYVRSHPSMHCQEPVASRDRELVELMPKFRQLLTSSQRVAPAAVVPTLPPTGERAAT